MSLERTEALVHAGELLADARAELAPYFPDLDHELALAEAHLAAAVREAFLHGKQGQ